MVAYSCYLTSFFEGTGSRKGFTIMKNSLADIFVRAAVTRETLFPVAIIFS